MNLSSPWRFKLISRQGRSHRLSSRPTRPRRHARMAYGIAGRRYPVLIERRADCGPSDFAARASSTADVSWSITAEASSRLPQFCAETRRTLSDLNSATWCADDVGGW